MRGFKKMNQVVDAQMMTNKTPESEAFCCDRRARQKRIRAFRGKMKWSGDLDEMRRDKTNVMRNDSVTAPKGFLGAGVASGVKVSGNLDLGILACPTGATAAAVFTTNKIVSAGVQVSREHIQEP